MMLRTLGGVLAAAFCGAALLSAPAQAATVEKTAAAAPSAVPTMASDCWYSHTWNGYWHRHARYVCDDDDDYYYDNDYYYYPGYYYGGGYGYRHGFGHGFGYGHGFGHGGFGGHHGRR